MKYSSGKLNIITYEKDGFVMLLRFSPKVEHLKCVVLSPKDGSILSKTMIQLLPGVNEVTDAEWKAMKPNIVDELKRGEISILAQKVSAGRGKPEGKKAKDLADMPVNIAVKYVSECNSVETLKKWYSEITNEEVRLAITKRFQKLEIELPEDEIPETPNESPMTLAEFEADENDESETNDDLDDSDDKDDKDDKDTEDKEDEDSDDEKSDSDYSSMTVAQLKSICEERGIDTKKISKKIDLINALEKKDNLDEE